MSINDPIGDMLTRVRNAIMNGSTVVAMPSTKLKIEIARILKEEGYIEDYEVTGEEIIYKKVLRLRLKYVGERRERKSVIDGLARVSKPGRRVYTDKQGIPWVLSGMGIAILTTPKGVMTGHRAKQLGVGGEILCKVW